MSKRQKHFLRVACKDLPLGRRDLPICRADMKACQVVFEMERSVVPSNVRYLLTSGLGAVLIGNHGMSHFSPIPFQMERLV